MIIYLDKPSLSVRVYNNLYEVYISATFISWMEGMPIYYIYFWVQVRLKTWFFRRGAHGLALECETGSRGPTIYAPAAACGCISWIHQAIRHKDKMVIMGPSITRGGTAQRCGELRKRAKGQSANVRRGATETIDGDTA